MNFFFHHFTGRPFVNRSLFILSLRLLFTVKFNKEYLGQINNKKQSCFTVDAFIVTVYNAF